MTSAFIPVFLNGRPALVAPGTTLGQLVAQEDPELFKALKAGMVRIADGRGVASDRDTVLTAGAIFRVFQSARSGGGPTDA